MPAKAAPKPRSKTAADHVSYQDMIIDAIVTLKERNGSSRIALKKYIKANNKNIVDGKMFDSLFNRALKAGVEKGIFAQPKGASGGTKLAKKVPKPSKPVAKSVETKASTEKKSAEKKSVTKKSVATKKATSHKSETTPGSKAAKSKAPAKTKKVTSKESTADKPTALSRTKSGRVTKTTAADKKTATKKKTPVKKAITKKPASS